ncbi:MAG TPA: sulfatase-like hydrolase/transferase [Steroidobacteraceae bacterium]|nr:sulfatase-like hydrolase/transferase [Steroidobacteraceae bacterium]
MKAPGRDTPASGARMALLLGFALLLLSYLPIATLLNSDAFHSPRVVAETLTEPLWRTRLGLNILLFALAQLALHLSFGALCWLLALASESAWPRLRLSRRKWILLWFLAGVLWLMVANASLFPRASLGMPYRAVGHARVFGVALHVLLGCCIAAAITATVLRAAWTTLGTGRLAILAGVAILPVAVTGLPRPAAVPAATGAAPNVILIGIDSLRPDLATAENTPHVRAFLDGSVQFSDAVTPLARTFPSWVSILTGRHPHTTGALMNLLPRDLIHEGQTLPELLRARGYRTMYAIDETRFSNVDASYGFDRTVTPPIGGSDFVLTWFADTPLSNLVTNTWLGALLFPYQYANRSAFVTYEPDTFVRRVDHALAAQPQPLFLALHLTLPHWPYEWSDAALPSLEEAGTFEAQLRWKYLNASRRADRQFGDLLAALQRKGLLANAIVIALSDHGEALGAQDEFLTAALPGEEQSDISAQQKGHGTSVLSPRQYHTVLGLRAYGAAAALLPPPRTVAEPVSLLDITPTVLDLLRTTPAQPLDGMSLLPLLREEPGAAQRFAARVRFTESEYNPGGFDTSTMTASALAAAAMVYQVDPRTDRLRVRRELIQTILDTRQYAVLCGGSFAAALPKETGGSPYTLVYAPGPGRRDPHEQARLSQALEQKFNIRFGDRTIRISPES